MKIASWHKGYQKLSEIIDLARKRDKYFIYHSGIDKFYLRASEESENVNFSLDRYCQAKGSVLDFQCKPCQKHMKDIDKNKSVWVDIDYTEGKAIKFPNCK